MNYELNRIYSLLITIINSDSLLTILLLLNHRAIMKSQLLHPPSNPSTMAAERLAAGDHLAALPEVHRQHWAIATGLEVEKQRAVLGHGGATATKGWGFCSPIFHGTMDEDL